jgi:hypothetical protein
MTKKTLLILSTLNLAYSNVALNPSSPLFPEEGLFIAKESLASLKAGYYVDYIFKTSLQNRHKISHASAITSTQYGALALTLADLVDLYGFVGMQNNKLYFRKNDQGYTYKQSGSFSWALYADGILNQWGKLQLGAGAFYSSTPKQEGCLYIEKNNKTPSNYQSYAWGVSLGFAYDYPPCTPYARLDFQYSKSLISALKNEYFHTLHPLGLSFGFTSDLSKGFFIDVEGRVIQAYAARALLGFRF